MENKNIKGENRRNKWKVVHSLKNKLSQYPKYTLDNGLFTKNIKQIV